jgi:dihydropteroate synthase
VRVLRCADKDLTFERPRIMGVLNITPDSFSDGGSYFERGQVDVARVRGAAEEMLDGGAAVLDVGGESTRPGADPVSRGEELGRVIPVIEALARLDTIVSVDTRHAEVARVAVQAGARMVNDVSAAADPDMLGVVTSTQVGYAVMHMQGTPQTMQHSPHYADVVSEVRDYLSARIDCCVAAGVDPVRLMVDPGFGFGKTMAHNTKLLSRLQDLRCRDLPLLVGLSRKSMLGAITGRAVGERVHASVAAALLAAQRGADLLRVHDVAATSDALKVLTALRGD